MEKEMAISYLKSAMKAELDGINIYQTAAEKTTDQEVKTWFIERANEEKQHFNYLLQYFNEINDKPGMDMEELKIELKDEPQSIMFSPNFLKRVGEKQILFSAISTSVLLEKNAIDFYTKCAELINTTALHKLFVYLAEWEKKHYEVLLEIQKESETFYWEQNQFSPF